MATVRARATHPPLDEIRIALRGAAHGDVDLFLNQVDHAVVVLHFER